MRIVSLLPSATEMVYALGLGDQLIGVSHECDYPPEAKGKAVMIKPTVDPGVLGSLEIDRRISARLTAGESVYILDEEALRAADPDLVLTQEVCDVCAVAYRQVESAAGRLPRKPEILSLDPKSLWDVVKDLQRVATATGTTTQAKAVVSDLRRRVELVIERAKEAPIRPRVVCLEWLDPLYNAGHWVPEMVELAGGEDLLAVKGMPSIKIPWERVLAARPDVLILMPCGFDIQRTLKEIHLVTRLPGWTDLPAVTGRRVYAVNGHAYFNRPGPRLADGLEILAHLFQPGLFPAPPPPGAVQRLA